MNATDILEFFPEKQWAAISAVGTAAQAAIALVGLIFIGYQIRLARKTGDLQSLQEFLRATKEHEHALIESRDISDDEHEKAFFEYLNFLELQAAALHGDLFSNVTGKIAREKIRDSISVIEEFEPWMRKLEAGISSETTFEHLRKFCKRERRNINKVKAARAKMVDLDLTKTPAGTADK